MTDGDIISYTSGVNVEHEDDIGRHPAPVELNLVPKESSETGRKTRKSESLSREWDTQSISLAKSHAGKIGLSEEEYRESLPRFSRRPRNFGGELEIPAGPVIVETRIPLLEMLRVVGINSFFDLQELEDWENGDFRTSSKPYTTWLTYLPNKSVEEVRANLGRNELGGTVLEGITLYQRRSQILNHHFLKFPGSQVGSDYVPFLSALPSPESPGTRSESEPRYPSLNMGSIDSKSSKFACLIASKS